MLHKVTGHNMPIQCDKVTIGHVVCDKVTIGHSMPLQCDSSDTTCPPVTQSHSADQNDSKDQRIQCDVKCSKELVFRSALVSLAHDYMSTLLNSIQDSKMTLAEMIWQRINRGGSTMVVKDIPENMTVLEMVNQIFTLATNVLVDHHMNLADSSEFLADLNVRLMDFEQIPIYLSNWLS